MIFGVATNVVASSPDPSFSLAAKKREGAWDPKSRDKRSHDVLTKAQNYGGRKSSISELSATFSNSKVGLKGNRLRELAPYLSPVLNQSSEIYLAPTRIFHDSPPFLP